MSTVIRRIAIIFVKTLTGNTIDVELDLDDGEWREDESHPVETTTDSEPTKETQVQNHDVDAKMDVVVGDSEAASEDAGETNAIETEPRRHAKKARIRHLKQLVFEKQGIPPNQQRLVYQGKQLTDEDVLDELGLKDQTVHLVLALRGGCL